MILLDTNALLWVLSDSSDLGPRSSAMLRGGGPVHYSSVNVLEIVIKEMLGKLSVPGPTSQAAADAGLHELSFTAEHAQRLKDFPDLVRHDPFDRMLLAQARAEGMRLLTSDRTLLALGRPDVMDAHT